MMAIYGVSEQSIVLELSGEISTVPIDGMENVRGSFIKIYGRNVTMRLACLPCMVAIKLAEALRQRNIPRPCCK